MLAVDPRHRGTEPFSRIEPVDAAAAGDEMRIGENHELHRSMVSLFQAL